MYLIAGSKKSISSNQLHRTLGITLKTAWFMAHRIREAMRSARFRAEVERLVAARELNPTEADDRFERLLAHIATTKRITPPHRVA